METGGEITVEVKNITIATNCEMDVSDDAEFRPPR
jgi:hypothetical protein